MKKQSKYLCLLLLLLFGLMAIVGCQATNDGEKEDPTNDNPDDQPVVVETKRMLNADGSFGGTLNSELYGTGTPRNGEADIEDSSYFLTPDVYNLPSTKNRTVYSKFETYQKTMSDSDGIACAMMIMNRDGFNMNTYTEETLVSRYEQLNGTTVYGNGTTSAGLKKLLENYGYDDVEVNSFAMTASTRADKTQEVRDFIEINLASGYLIIVKLQYGLKAEWKLIIGIDEMKTTSDYDDVIIMANPDDVLDHKQDGYTWVPIAQFWAWWMDAQPSGQILDKFGSLVVKLKKAETIKRVTDNSSGNQVVPERHLILNADGTFGGTSDPYFGTGTTRGGNDNLDSRYYKFIDYYNLEPTENLHVLPHYRAFQQTMASTCGICSGVSICTYYGYSNGVPSETNNFDELHLMYYFYKSNGNKTVYNVGIGARYAATMFKSSFGINASYHSYSSSSYVNESSKVYPHYEDFVDQLKKNLDNGIPTAVSWKPVGGHWEVLIGYDDMGTENIYDDIVIFADSSDVADHYQDGYNVYNATVFYGRWFNGNHATNQQAYYWPRSQTPVKAPNLSLTIAQVVSEKVR